LVSSSRTGGRFKQGPMISAGIAQRKLTLPSRTLFRPTGCTRAQALSHPHIDLVPESSTQYDLYPSPSPLCNDVERRRGMVRVIVEEQSGETGE
jgi:hypothetical protein